MSKIAIVDYGMGNLYSVAKAVEHVVSAQDTVCVTSSSKVICNSDKVIFPGQGAAKDCMSALQEFDLQNTIIKVAKEKPFLGICMGMQVLMEHSEENEGTSCLGIYDGSVQYFGNHICVEAGQDKFKVPHMGWNCVEQTMHHPLWKDIPQSSYFYFVHSYFVNSENENLVAGTTDYSFSFTSALAQENVFAMQCHPEKSAKAGLQLLHNFIHWNGNYVTNQSDYYY